MTTTVTTSRNATVAKPNSRLARTPVSIVGAAAAVVGAISIYGYGAAAQALSVPMHAGDPGASHAVPITPANFSGGVVFCTVLGTLLAVGLARWAGNPARTFQWTAWALVAVSLVFPLLASHTAESTRLTLALAHVVAAAIVIPVLTRRLGAVRRQP